MSPLFGDCGLTNDGLLEDNIAIDSSVWSIDLLFIGGAKAEELFACRGGLGCASVNDDCCCSLKLST